MAGYNVQVLAVLAEEEPEVAEVDDLRGLEVEDPLQDRRAAHRVVGAGHAMREVAVRSAGQRLVEEADLPGIHDAEEVRTPALVRDLVEGPDLGDLRAILADPL